MAACLARSKDYILHKKGDPLPVCALLCPVIKTLLLKKVSAIYSSLTKVSIIHVLVLSNYCLVCFLRNGELSTLFSTSTNDVVTSNIHAMPSQPEYRILCKNLMFPRSQLCAGGAPGQTYGCIRSAVGWGCTPPPPVAVGR
jgi:hypothetical protein